MEVERILKDLGYTWKNGLGHAWKGHIQVGVQGKGSWVIKEYSNGIAWGEKEEESVGGSVGRVKDAILLSG